MDLEAGKRALARASQILAWAQKIFSIMPMTDFRYFMLRALVRMLLYVMGGEDTPTGIENEFLDGIQRVFLLLRRMKKSSSGG